jgi:hypothetical protein
VLQRLQHFLLFFEAVYFLVDGDEFSLAEEVTSFSKAAALLILLVH